MVIDDPSDPAYLFGAIFHQDWDLDGPDDAAVIARFVAASTDRNALSRLAHRLIQLADEHDDAALERVVFAEYGCEYDPRGDMPLRAWLHRLATLLTAT